MRPPMATDANSQRIPADTYYWPKAVHQKPSVLCGEELKPIMTAAVPLWRANEVAESEVREAPSFLSMAPTGASFSTFLLRILTLRCLTFLLL